MPIWFRSYKMPDGDYRIGLNLDIDTSEMFSLYVNIELELIKWGFNLEIKLSR